MKSGKVRASQYRAELLIWRPILVKSSAVDKSNMSTPLARAVVYKGMVPVGETLTNPRATPQRKRAVSLGPSALRNQDTFHVMFGP